MIPRDGEQILYKSSATRIVLLVVCLFITLPVLGETLLYRFTNAQGKVEISSSIPNERVKFGYDVLDQSGRVIRRVAPELTGAELEAKRKKEAELAKCRETWRRVSAMYQTEADIALFEKEEIEALETAVANERANLLVLKGQHTDLLAQAARIERSGGTLNSVLIQNIERAASQVKLLEQSIRKRESERKRISSRFNAERAAFRRGNC